MRKILGYVLSVLCVMTALTAAVAFGDPSEKQIKAMSLFLSNFTELGFMDVDVEEMERPDNYPDLVRFGIWHNYINNFKSRIEANKADPEARGDLRIKASYVEESVKKYFGIKMRADRSVDQADPPYFFKNGYFSFWGADGEAPWYARVKAASSPQRGVWEVHGEIYNADDPKELYGSFSATIQEATWGTKRTYVMVRMTSEYKPKS